MRLTRLFAVSFTTNLIRAAPSARTTELLLDQRQVLGQGNWSSITCTDPGVTDAARPPQERWAEVNAEGAWSAIALSWNNEPRKNGNWLPFPQFVSNFFHGPEGWDCSDIGNEQCSSGSVQCHDVTKPAGYFILNSFAKLQGTYKELNIALGDAQASMLGELGTFTSTFTEEKPPAVDMIKLILDAIGLVTGVASAGFWNKIAGKYIADNNNRGWSKDTANVAIAFSIVAAKDSLPAAKSKAGAQSDLGSGLSVYFDALQKANTDFVRHIFSAANGALGDLHRLLSDGKFNYNGHGPDIGSMKDEYKKLLYGQMIPAAWQLSPKKLYPFILESSNACTSQAEGQLKDHMSDDTAAWSHACWEGKIYYLLNAVPKNPCRPRCSDIRGRCMPSPGSCDAGTEVFQSLPGGRWGTISQFGGVTIDDIVISSMRGYRARGNKNGDASIAPTSIPAGTDPNSLFGEGIRTQGFFNIPICPESSLKALKERLTSPFQWNQDKDKPFAPCV